MSDDASAGTAPINDFNRQMIEQFRAGGGRMDWGGPMSLLLLTTQGAKTGKTHTTPLAAYAEDGRAYVIASYGGNPKHPAWYHNLVANPVVEVEHDGETYEAEARVLPDAERDPIFVRVVENAAQFGEYQEKTSRKIPVVELRRLEVG
jgi:deazaflavin-dependent oxidoreductase (nitroreductase family)